MAYFDEGDQPRGAGRGRMRRPGGPPGAGGGADPIMVRRVAAAVIAVLILLLLVFGVRSCQQSARENALRDFNQDLSSVAAESEEIRNAFFQTLANQPETPLDQQTTLNQLRVRSERLADRGRNLDVPGQVTGAARDLIVGLDLRAGAIAKVAQRLPAARGDEEAAAESSLEAIAGQMQAFVASDVLWLGRVAPLTREALDAAEVTGERVPTNRFLTDLDWLDPATVATRIGSSATGGGGEDEEPAPGTHGHGLTSVSVGDTTLQPVGSAPNRVPASGNVTFTVAFQNQGTNEESDVRVRVRVRGAGDPITVTKTVDQTNPGATAEVAVPLGQAPPIGTPVTVQVEVLPVPGEELVENNRQEYTVLFTRG